MTFCIGGVLGEECNGRSKEWSRNNVPDLYKGLGLKPESLSMYDTPLVGYDGKVMTPEGQVKLSVLTKGKKVEVNFIVVNAFSPYTANNRLKEWSRNNVP